MRIINTTNNASLATQARMADTAISRLIGLLNRRNLFEGEALVITQCRGIHMFFMRFTIDVVFVDKAQSVVGLVENIKPFQMSPYFFRACHAIELPAGTIKHTQTRKGDKISYLE